MPFETQTTPFVGDDDFGDFMLDVWLPFARDDAKWVDNRAPVVGTRPEIEVWTHRGTVGVPAAPYVFYRTTDRHLYIFTGTGVNLGEELYDQPGNPANAPVSAAFDFPKPIGTAGPIGGMGCQFINSAVGTYAAYWLFSDTSGAYIHCVIKVNARQYRHFHVGLLSPLHSDLSDQSFYITGHFVSLLDPEALSMTQFAPFPTDLYHDPYSTAHRFPFGTINFFGASPTLQGMATKFHMPGVNAETTSDFYIPHASDGRLHAAVGKSVGGVNTSGYVHGRCQCNGYGNGLGVILFNADRTFAANTVPLVPIYVAPAVSFSADDRVGPIAQVPDVFRISMANLAPEQEITVGSDTYVVFPVVNSASGSTLAGEGYSAFEGLAYRKETGVVP